MPDPISNDVTQSTVDWSVVRNVPARLEMPDIGAHPRTAAPAHRESATPDFIVIDRQQLDKLLQLIKTAEALPASATSAVFEDVALSRDAALPDDGAPPPPNASARMAPGGAPVVAQPAGDPRNAAPMPSPALSSTEVPVAAASGATLAQPASTPAPLLDQTLEQVPSLPLNQQAAGGANSSPGAGVAGGNSGSNPDAAMANGHATKAFAPGTNHLGGTHSAAAPERSGVHQLAALLERLVQSPSSTVFGSSLLHELATPGRTVSPQLQVFTDHQQSAAKAFFVQEGSDPMRVVIVESDLSLDGSQTARVAAKMLAKELNDAMARAFDGNAPMKAKVSLQDGAAVIHWVRTKNSQQPIVAGEVVNNQGYQLFAQPEDKAAARPSLFHLPAPVSHLDEFEAAALRQPSSGNIPGDTRSALTGPAVRDAGIGVGSPLAGVAVNGKEQQMTNNADVPDAGVPIGLDAATQHAGYLSAWTVAVPTMMEAITRARTTLFGAAAVGLALYIAWSDPSHAAEAFAGLGLVAVTALALQLWNFPSTASLVLRWPFRLPFPSARAALRHRGARALGRREPREYFELQRSPKLLKHRRQLLQAGGSMPPPPSIEQAYAELGVPVAAPWRAVVAAFRIGVRRMHPDTGITPDAAALDRLVQSYAVLRATYRRKR